MDEKKLEQYLGLPYRIEVFRDNDEDDPGWVARVVELPGCITQADTFEELGEMVDDAMRAWLEVAIERGIPIPEPRPLEDYSGKFVVRVPKSLHRELVEKASTEGVSLNQLVNVALAGAVTQPVQSSSPSQESAERNWAWPSLSMGARQTLSSANYSDEADKIDERLFSDWLSRQFATVQSSLEMGHFRQATDDINWLVASLRSGANHSPILENYVQTLEMVCQLMHEISSMPDPAVVAQRLTKAAIASAFQPTREHYISIQAQRYSAVSTLTEDNITRQRVTKLFQDVK